MTQALVPPDLIDRFAREWMVDHNATQAYLRIKPDVKPTSAATLGLRLLRKVETLERLRVLQLEQNDRLRIDADSVTQELARCGFSDVRHYQMSEQGHFELAPGVHPLASRAVASIKRKRTVRTFGQGDRAVEVEENTLEYRLHPKVESLKLLGQHLGILGSDEPAGGGTLTVIWVNEG